MNEPFFWSSVIVICVIALGILIYLRVRQAPKKHESGESVAVRRPAAKRPQPDDGMSQLSRSVSQLPTSTFIMSGYALGIAAGVARFFWFRIFDALFSSKDAVISADLHAIKPLINITMYVVPTTLAFLAIGFFIVGHFMLLARLSDDALLFVQRWRQARREGQCQKN